MDDVYEYLARVVIALREDSQLVECFNRVLKFGASTQQVRVATLKKELESLSAPEEVMTFVKLLEDEKIAHLVLRELNS